MIKEKSDSPLQRQIIKILVRLPWADYDLSAGKATLYTSHRPILQDSTDQAFVR